ncbi:Lrp/AsnC family transcriptional regulator [Marinobacter sp. ANT_B65]|uniref:Lrp/AsnC family transcriptional regulator n=1 Tax=Marinobacter sp. ANT_B65 TaxID=2039467 RepID=UPI0039B6FFCE
MEEYRAVLSRSKMGFSATAFTQVTFSSHDVDLTDEFEAIVNELDWVQTCHCITGSVDYLLQMVFRDLDEFSERINIIRRIRGVNAIQTHISVKEIKTSTSLPIG